jgi:hypothetical protein
MSGAMAGQGQPEPGQRHRHKEVAIQDIIPFFAAAIDRFHQDWKEPMLGCGFGWGWLCHSQGSGL